MVVTVRQEYAAATHKRCGVVAAASQTQRWHTGPKGWDGAAGTNAAGVNTPRRADKVLTLGRMETGVVPVYRWKAAGVLWNIYWISPFTGTCSHAEVPWHYTDCVVVYAVVTRKATLSQSCLDWTDHCEISRKSPRCRSLDFETYFPSVVVRNILYLQLGEQALVPHVDPRSILVAVVSYRSPLVRPTDAAQSLIMPRYHAAEHGGFTFLPRHILWNVRRWFRFGIILREIVDLIHIRKACRLSSV